MDQLIGVSVVILRHKLLIGEGIHTEHVIELELSHHFGWRYSSSAQEEALVRSELLEPFPSFKSWDPNESIWMIEVGIHKQGSIIQVPLSCFLSEMH